MSGGDMFDREPGETVQFEIDDEPVRGTVKEVERGTPVDDLPEPGETVTFKGLGGHIDRRVAEVNRDDECPIVVEHGGRYQRTNFVEYTEEETFTIVELEDGREVWPSVEGGEA